MRGVRLNLEGMVFGRLTVKSFDVCKKHHSYWNCVCECGNKVTVRGGNLTAGKIKSCGCLWNEMVGLTNLTHGHSVGGCRDYLYVCYSQIISRCYNKNNKNYKDYGGRGITVCDRWLGESGLVNFVNDMGDRPADKTSIDRIDNDKGYSPENCRWATNSEQANNKRSNKLFLFCGNVYTLSQLCEKFSLKYQKTLLRLDKLGWSTTEAFGQLVLPYNKE